MGRIFYKQLDGLRAIAVSGVLCSHWISYPLVKKIGLGFWGVNLFFVLSGFLITEILLKSIEKKDQPREILKSFYLKRSLRIFPIYYLVIIFAYLFNLDQSRAIIAYTATYTLNFYNALSGDVGNYLSHLWSLCVEEQFYILWPFFLLIFKRSQFFIFLVAIIIVSITFRFVTAFYKIEHYEIYNYRMMPACLDSLGLGAMLAYCKLYHSNKLVGLLRYYSIPIALIILYALIVFNGNGNSLFNEVLLRLIVSICCFFIIGNAVYEYKNVFGKFLELRLLQYLGRISYGIYLYHLFVSIFLASSLNEFIVSNSPRIFPLFIKYNTYFITAPIYFLITLLIAGLSFHYIEKPFIRLKNRLN